MSVTNEPSSIGPRSVPLEHGAKVAGRYTIESVLGDGMTGVVYRARRDSDDGLVALKIIHRELCADELTRKRVRLEARILQHLEGPHIVKLHDVFEEDDGRLVLVLELVHGTSLETILQEEPPSMELAIEITLQICAALGAAHAAGVIHRDLKPANVLIERLQSGASGAGSGGGGLRVRVVDFGLAKVIRSDIRQSGSLTERDLILGTPEYIAPEQVRGEAIDYRTDIYSLGIILFEMITGDVPYHGKTPLETMAGHLSPDVPRPRKARDGSVVPPSLTAVIARALGKQPANRYPSARALAEALTAAWGERLVITPSGVDNAESLATIDTELNVNTEGLNAVDMTPGPVVVSANIGRRSRAELLEDAAAPTQRLPKSSLGDRALWIGAVVLALICVAVGVWIGIR